ncbi:MAG: hypothetical protein MI861_25400, partial [Pirellulales bacterium]|nr:hypothetical protein [Pirellulales bacterium]
EFQIPSFSFVVSTLSDVADGNYEPGQVSLREAIEFANLIPGANTITFDGSLAGGTINLGGRLPTITSSVTITGLGPNLLTIDAGNGQDNRFKTGDGFRIFEINDGNFAARSGVTISGLTLTGGDVGNAGQGGAILTREDSTVTNSVLSVNAATDDGGAIYATSSAILRITDSTLAGNHAGDGGGAIHVDRAGMFLDNSTLSQNTARVGGGVSIVSGGIAATNSTWSGNSAQFGGAIINVAGNVKVANSTLAANTGVNGDSLYSVGAFGQPINFFGNSIITGSVDTPTQTGNHNLFSNTVTITGTGNLQNMDPKLGPLQNNGGPTPTHALLAGSPALNAGDPNAVAGVGGVPQFDQRGTGFGRVDGGRVDIGAFEVNVSLLSFTRQTPTTQVTGADSLVFRATFDEDVTNVDASDFTVGGTTTATITSVVSVDAKTYDITVSGGDLADFNGIVGLFGLRRRRTPTTPRNAF